MARYPSAVWRPLSDATQEPLITATQVILHSAVGPGSIFDYFNNNTNLESHFWVGLDGLVEQYQDTARQADANFHGNVRAISIESADNGHPDSFPWTDAQLDSIDKLLRWACETHNIPKVVCPAWDKPGIGYHTMWGSPSNWTPVSKSCPGTARVKQFPGIMARLIKEIEVPLTQAEIDDIAKAVWATKFQEFVDENASGARDLRTVADILFSTHKFAYNVSRSPIIQSQIAELATAIASAITTTAPGGTVSQADKDEIATIVADVLAERLTA